MTTNVQISTALGTFVAEGPMDWTQLVDYARAADEVGFDRLTASDHVVFGEDLEAYADPKVGGSKGGKQPTGPDGLWLDPLVTIADLTAVTRRVRFETAILIVALRRPVVLAKMAATIDVLSGGRLDLGVGVGWQAEEYEAAGLSFKGRGRTLNHTIEVCQALWREQRVSYDSDELSFANIHQMPKPTQPGGVPVWVSGTVNKQSMDRLAAYGSGWIPWGDDAADIEAGIKRMRGALAERGRDSSELGIVGNVAAVMGDNGKLDLKKTMLDVPRLAAAGVTDVRVRPLAGPKGFDAIKEFLGEVVDAFRSAAA